MESSLKPLRISLVVLAAMALGACGREAEQAQSAPPAPTVSVAQVLQQPVVEWDEVTGRLEAPETVEIRPRVSGYIDRVAFEEGSSVRKGDLLFQIDPRPFEAEVKRLEAQLAQARAQQRRTASEAERGERCASVTPSPPSWPMRVSAPPRKPEPPPRRSPPSWKRPA